MSEIPSFQLQPAQLNGRTCKTCFRCVHPAQLNHDTSFRQTSSPQVTPGEVTPVGTIAMCAVRLNNALFRGIQLFFGSVNGFAFKPEVVVHAALAESARSLARSHSSPVTVITRGFMTLKSEVLQIFLEIPVTLVSWAQCESTALFPATSVFVFHSPACELDDTCIPNHSRHEQTSIPAGRVVIFHSISRLEFCCHSSSTSVDSLGRDAMAFLFRLERLLSAAVVLSFLFPTSIKSPLLDANAFTDVGQTSEGRRTRRVVCITLSRPSLQKSE